LLADNVIGLQTCDSIPLASSQPKQPVGPLAPKSRSNNGISMNNIIKAMAFAADKHRNQRRKDTDASPYINHPIAVANVLANEAHIGDERVLMAAILHDTIEDTETTEQELVRHFGQEVADLVLELTDDKKLPSAERKRLQVEHAGTLSRRAKLTKVSDKIANLRDVANTPPADWPLERKREYFDWAKAVVDGVRGGHPELERIFDETYKLRP
jgi:GTP diphosphokinase / guanosine-3',5'-bis(diphosphate) 3'-diphosphatase